MAKPGDGIRSIYLPKDLNDFTYYPCGYVTGAVGNTNKVRTRNGGRNPDADPLELVLPLADPDYFLEGVAPPVDNI
jgi:hypothetical protein